ncbi:MAG: alpha/beta hydrolase [Gammaproteobacteria bacterium]|nr:alpha/beta hydrolase [Gammaproteobacteria bacterium]
MSDAPHWFLAAIETPAESCFIDCFGTPIHYRRYARKPGRPTLLFVHGHGAHCHWWDFIAPSFTDTFNVLTMDMAGAGDSGHRDEYSAATFSDEIIEVCRAERSGAVYIVGHSFGGSMTRVAGWRFGRELAGIILADSVITNRKSSRGPVPRSSGRKRSYASLEEAKRRFRLRPPQPCANAWILDHIAEHSVTQTDEGFRFKLDQDVFAKMVEPEGPALPDGVTMLSEMACPAALIYGEQSRFFPPEAVELAGRAIAPEHIVCLSEAHHHLFVDQPLAFIDALRDVLGTLASP